MAVPTHYFKVVLGERQPGDAVVGAWVMPNMAIDPDVPLTAFTVPLTALETVAGIEFFPGYLDDQRREALDETGEAGATGCVLCVCVHARARMFTS